MRCPNCGKNLGAGIPPVRCAECGHEFTPDEIEEAVNSDIPPVSSEAVSELVGENAKKRFLIGMIAIGACVLLLVGGLVAFVMWTSSFSGGIILPDVVGMDVSEAKEKLDAEGFSSRETEQRSDEKPGTVLEQDPAAGTRLEKGSRVTLTVAGARTMPDVIGHTLDEAKGILDAESIAYETKEVASPEQAGLVLDASIKAGDRVLSTDVVTLSIAGPYVIPQVVGLAQDDAWTLLTDNSFTPNLVVVPVTEGQTEGTVIACDPPEGTQAAAGTTVTITVAAGVTSQLRGWARSVIEIVYGKDCIVNETYRIGAELRRWLRGSEIVQAIDGTGTRTVAEASDYEVWFGIVKHWNLFPNYGDALQQLNRSLNRVDIEVDPETGTAVCTIDVQWYWDRLGNAEYIGVTSHDTRVVTLTFDADGYLVNFNDPLTDVPKHDQEFIDQSY